MKIRAIKIAIIASVEIAGFLLWRSIDRAVNIPEASVWLLPIIMASLFFTSAYVAIISIKKITYLYGIFFAVYGISFIFAQNPYHWIGIFIGWAITIIAVWKIKSDLQLNVRFSARKSIFAGSSMFIFAASMVIVSQYYWLVSILETEKLIPQFYISSIAGGLTSRLLIATNPGIKEVDQENLTIDQFILQTQNGELQSREISLDTNMQIDRMIEKTNPTATEAQKKILKEDALQKVKAASLEIGKGQNDLLLSEGRKKFSELSGRTLQGNEKIADVLAAIVNNKIDQYFGANAKNNGNVPLLPYIMAVGLMLTIIPMGSILNNLWALAASGLMYILMKSGIVNIKKVAVEMDVLE